MIPIKVGHLHGKTPMITYGKGVSHKTSTHTYNTISVDHTENDHSSLVNNLS